MTCEFCFAVLQIKFERPAYTFNEPAAYSTDFEDEVFLVKSGLTELTYDVILQVRQSEQPVRNQDFEIYIESDASSVLTFYPHEQRKPLFFSVHADGIPEGVEVLEISSEPDSFRGQAYQRPSDGAITRLIIIDDDSKKHNHYCNNIIDFLYLYRHYSWME